MVLATKEQHPERRPEPAVIITVLAVRRVRERFTLLPFGYSRERIKSNGRRDRIGWSHTEKRIEVRQPSDANHVPTHM